MTMKKHSICVQDSAVISEMSINPAHIRDTASSKQAPEQTRTPSGKTGGGSFMRILYRQDHLIRGLLKLKGERRPPLRTRVAPPETLSHRYQLPALLPEPVLRVTEPSV